MVFSTFRNIKGGIVKISKRSLPDFRKRFILTTDTSNIALGAGLSQVNNTDVESLISCFSKKFDKVQMKYSVTDKELTDLVKSIEHFKHYFLGKEFILRTDHIALKYLNRTINENIRLLRMASKFQDCKFTLEYVKGEVNIADLLQTLLPFPELSLKNSQQQKEQKS